MRFTAYVHWPVGSKHPAHEGQGCGCTCNAIHKTGGMQAGLSQAQGVIKAVYGKGGVYIMDLVPCGAYFLYCREQHRLIIKNTYNKIFCSHMLKNSKSIN